MLGIRGRYYILATAIAGGILIGVLGLIDRFWLRSKFLSKPVAAVEFAGRSELGNFRARATISITLDYPLLTSTSDAFTIRARVRIDKVEVVDREKSDNGRYPADYLVGRAQSEVNDLFADGSLGLALRLAGADVQPKDTAPIVNSQAWWSVKANGDGILQGFVSPLVIASGAIGSHQDSHSRFFMIDSMSIVADKTQAFQIKVRTPIQTTTWSVVISVCGTLLTIPGILAFIDDM